MNGTAIEFWYDFKEGEAVARVTTTHEFDIDIRVPITLVISKEVMLAVLYDLQIDASSMKKVEI